MLLLSAGIGVGSDDLLERRASLAPQSMQWAIRSRAKGGRTGIGGSVAGSSSVPATSGGGGFIYIDPTSLRRSTTRCLTFVLLLLIFSCNPAKILTPDSLSVVL